MRGGLLGQGSVLTITSYSTRTSPVLRGKWVLENLLSAAPPPPPADVPSLKTETAPGQAADAARGDDPASRQPRRAPAATRGWTRSASRWRTSTPSGDGASATASSRSTPPACFPEGTKFDGIPGLKKELLRQPEQFVGTVAERLLMYAIGRNLQYYDAPTVRAVMRDAAPANYTLASLVLGIVKSRPFQMREAGGE